MVLAPDMVTYGIILIQVVGLNTAQLTSIRSQRVSIVDEMLLMDIDGLAKKFPDREQCADVEADNEMKVLLPMGARIILVTNIINDIDVINLQPTYGRKFPKKCQERKRQQ